MNIFHKLFGSKVTQTITSESVHQSLIIQAGGNVNIQIPPEVLGKLVALQAREQPIEYPKIVETNEPVANADMLSDEIFIRLMQKTLLEIKTLIDDGRLSKAQGILTELLGTPGFDLVDVNFKVELHYYQGIVYLNTKTEQDVIACIDLMKEIDSNNKFVYNLQYKLAVSQGNDELFEQAISGLRGLNGNQDDIKLKILFNEINKNNFSKVIEELAELDSIKEEFKNNADALYYLGLAYVQTGNFSLGKALIMKSNEKSPLIYKKYLIILCDVLPIIHRTGAIYLLTDEEKALLQIKVDELLTIKHFIKEKDLEMQGEFWGYVLNIKLFLNPSEVIADVEQMEDSLKYSLNIQWALAEAYSFLGTGDKAEQIYKALHEKLKNPKILARIVTRLLENKDYKGIIALLSDIPYTEYDELGDIAGNLISAYGKLNDYEATLLKFNELNKVFEYAPLLLESAAHVAYQNEKIEDASSFMDRAISQISGDSEGLRLLISQSCKKLGFIDKAIEVLLPIRDNNKKIKEHLLNLALRMEDDGQKIALADGIINELLLVSQRDPDVLMAKAEIALLKERHKEALGLFCESFSIRPSIDCAYNIVALKLTIQESEEMQQYVDYLLQNKYPKARMIAALGLDFLGNRGSALENAYKALQMLEGSFDSSVYLHYSTLFLLSKNRTRDGDTSPEHTKIKVDTVITLEDNTGLLRYICLESNPEFVNLQGERYINCEHFTLSSPISIQLLNVGLNQKIELEGIEYYIKAILDKYVFAFHFVSSEYFKNCPDSPQFRIVRATEDDPITPILPYLQNDKNKIEFLIEQYNFANGVGMPISALCGNNYFKYPSAIQHLFNKKGQSFYAGEVTELNLLDEKTPIVLTISTVIVLKIIGHLDVIRHNSERFIITSSLLNQIRLLFDEATTKNMQIAGYMHMDDSGRPTLISVTDEEKQQTVEFWRELYLLLQKISSFDVSYELPHEIVLSNFLGEFEIEAIFLAKEKNAILVSDDLFIRKLGLVLNKELRTINSISILSLFLNSKQLIDAIHRLSEYQYSYCLNYNTVTRLIHDCFLSKPIIWGDGTEIDKFTRMVRNNMLYPDDFGESVSLFRDIVYHLYDNQINYQAVEITEIIIREIVHASRKFRINAQAILSYFLSPIGLDVAKSEYITTIFSEV